jgi:probable HAF family extracellular repeat protein
MPLYTYTTLDDPSAIGANTFAYGINDAGQIVGLYGGSDGYIHGFLYSGGIYTTLNDPSATKGTFARGINAAGQIVGYYNNNTGTHGFLLSGGMYPTLDDPLGFGFTEAFGINASGQIVGFYTMFLGDGKPHGFLLSGGLYATLDDPLGTNGTFAQGINDAGQIVGSYRDASSKSHGFLYNPNGRTYTTLDDPLATNGTLAYGINDAGPARRWAGRHSRLQYHRCRGRPCLSLRQPGPVLHGGHQRRRALEAGRSRDRDCCHRSSRSRIQRHATSAREMNPHVQRRGSTNVR